MYLATTDVCIVTPESAPLFRTTPAHILMRQSVPFYASFTSKNAPPKICPWVPLSPSGHQSPDRLASIVAADELKSLFPSHVWRLVCVDACYDDVLSQAGAVWRVMQARDHNAALVASFIALRCVPSSQYWYPSSSSPFSHASAV